MSDQIGAPTSAELIADITAMCLYRLQHDSVISSTASGTYHLVASGETSWHGYAQMLITEGKRYNMSLRTTVEKVLPIATHEYPLPAKRPGNSRLSTHKLQNTFGLVLPDWKVGAARMVKEMAELGSRE